MWVSRAASNDNTHWQVEPDLIITTISRYLKLALSSGFMPLRSALGNAGLGRPNPSLEYDQALRDKLPQEGTSTSDAGKSFLELLQAQAAR